MEEPPRPKTAQEEFFETMRPIWRWQAFVFKAKMIYAVLIIGICIVIGVLVLISDLRRGSSRQQFGSGAALLCRIGSNCPMPASTPVCDFALAALLADSSKSNDEVIPQLRKALDAQICQFGKPGLVVTLQETKNTGVVEVIHGGRRVGYAPKSQFKFD